MDDFDMLIDIDELLPLGYYLRDPNTILFGLRHYEIWYNSKCEYIGGLKDVHSWVRQKFLSDTPPDVPIEKCECAERIVLNRGCQCEFGKRELKNERSR